MKNRQASGFNKTVAVDGADAAVQNEFHEIDEDYDGNRMIALWQRNRTHVITYSRMRRVEIGMHTFHLFACRWNEFRNNNSSGNQLP